MIRAYIDFIEVTIRVKDLDVNWVELGLKLGFHVFQDSKLPQRKRE